MSISQLNGNDRLRAAQAAAALRSSAAYATPASSSPARQPDAVTLSDAARAMSNAQKTVGTSTGLREDRIQALKSAIADGTYNVSAQQLAVALLRHSDAIA
jgi:negative regulator of flagellin synthesis FlgM